MCTPIGKPGLGLGPILAQMVKRKVFLSYYHFDDQYYKNRFEELFSGMFINKSVNDGDINSDSSTDYIKRVIQTDYLGDTSVLIVLLGPNTYKRKHVDWEISAAISNKVGGRSGLLGVCLPTHPAYKSQNFAPTTVPPRLVANHNTGYAKIVDWTEDATTIKSLVDEAFNRKNNLLMRVDNSLPQFRYNR